MALPRLSWKFWWKNKMKYTNQRLARDYYDEKYITLDNPCALANCKKITDKIEKCRTDIPQHYHNNGNLAGSKELNEKFGRDTRKYLEDVLSKHVSRIKIKKGQKIEVLPTYGAKGDFW